MFLRKVALLDFPLESLAFFPINFEQGTLAPCTVSGNRTQFSAAYIQSYIYSLSFLSHSSVTFPDYTVAKGGSQYGAALSPPPISRGTLTSY